MGMGMEPRTRALRARNAAQPSQIRVTVRALEHAQTIYAEP